MRKEKENRNAEIVRLRDKGMKFGSIAEQFHITVSRAHQIYHGMHHTTTVKAIKADVAQSNDKKQSKKHIRVTLRQVAKAFRTTPDNLEVVIPQKGYIMKV